MVLLWWESKEGEEEEEGVLDLMPCSVSLHGDLHGHLVRQDDVRNACAGLGRRALLMWSGVGRVGKGACRSLVLYGPQWGTGVERWGWLCLSPARLAADGGSSREPTFICIICWQY